MTVHRHFSPLPACAPPRAAPLAGGRRARRRLLAAAGLCLALAAAPVPARDGGQARALAERGRIVALERLVREVSQRLPGRLLEAELEADDGQLVYELKWLLADGRRLEIEIDARDGRWLSLQGPRLETAFRPGAAPAPAQEQR